jgi:UDP-N-acetylmuramate dehydrogenase
MQEGGAVAATARGAICYDLAAGAKGLVDQLQQTSHLGTFDHIFADLNIRYESNAPLGPRTWYGVGGAAKVLAHPSSVQQLSVLASRCYEAAVPVYVLGSGANLLVGDEGVDSIVISLDDPHFRQIKISGTRAIAGGGADLSKLVLQTAKAGLAGLECLAGIPASVGGAVRMNAGGAYGDIGQCVDRVQVMDLTGQVYYRDRDDLVLSYRKTNIVARYILEVEFALTEDDPDELVKRVKEIFLYKKNTQPLSQSSAGCAFKNPWSEDQQQRLSAGKLIDEAGLKGYRVGLAEVSSHHANFVVAHPGAKAADVLAVLEHIEQTVRDKFGITLEREVVVWP